MFISAESEETTMTMFDQQVAAATEWFASPRFDGIVRLHTARQVAEQQGTHPGDYTVARRAAEAFYARLRELFEQRRQITTFGPYSPGQAVMMKRMGIEGIYLGGWATSAKGIARRRIPVRTWRATRSARCLTKLPDLVRALLTADKNQHFARSADDRTSSARRHRRSTSGPFIIADADTGHGGDAHVRNLIRRFVEVGVPGYHIEDQKPGAKKCGHQGGKVLVAEDEQIKRLNAARLQLDIMRVPGIIVARTDAEAATFLENRSDERDQPFILGATNLELPSYRVGLPRDPEEAATTWAWKRSAVTCSSRCPRPSTQATFAWLERSRADVADQGERPDRSGGARRDRARAPPRSDRHALRGNLAGGGGLKTYGEAVAERAGVPHGRRRAIRHDGRGVADVLEPGVLLRGPRDERSRWASGSSGIASCPRLPTASIRSRAGSTTPSPSRWLSRPSPTCCGWRPRRRTSRTPAKFAEAIHAQYPDKMLAYNLSPSFNWDTTGHER